MFGVFWNGWLSLSEKKSRREGSDSSFALENLLVAGYIGKRRDIVWKKTTRDEVYEVVASSFTFKLSNSQTLLTWKRFPLKSCLTSTTYLECDHQKPTIDERDHFFRIPVLRIILQWLDWMEKDSALMQIYGQKWDYVVGRNATLAIYEEMPNTAMCN